VKFWNGVRSTLIGFVIAGLAGLPAMAAGARPLGVVVTADNAHLSGATASIGADVFTGELLETEPNGTLRLKFGATQLYLNPASNVVLGQEANPLRVILNKGTVGFSSNVANQFEVQTPVGVVRSADGQRAFGEVTILGQNKILVAAYHGSLLVSGAGIERTITEGNAFNITLSPDPEPAGADPAPGSPQRAYHSGHPGLIFDGVILGGFAAAGYVAWHYSTESDTNPSNK
jgi:hypothetical protein